MFVEKYPEAYTLKIPKMFFIVCFYFGFLFCFVLCLFCFLFCFVLFCFVLFCFFIYGELHLKQQSMFNVPSEIIF